MANSLSCFVFAKDNVVNCFQISNFVLWQTATSQFVNSSSGLWIAFKLVILSYGKQLTKFTNDMGVVVNCFQISNFVLWQTALFRMCVDKYALWIAFKLVILSYGKQPDNIVDKLSCVVNCFQISNFVLWQTAFCLFFSYHLWLWIAFKLVILSYGKQRGFIRYAARWRCELLSN